MQKISKVLHPCHLSWIFSLMSYLMFVEVASELSSVNMANNTTCPLHSSFFIYVLLSLPFESNSGSLIFKNFSLVMCLLLTDYPHGYLHFALCPWWWEYGHMNGSGTLLHPLFVESIFMPVVVKVWSVDTWMGVEHFCIHCLWSPFSCPWWWKYGVWTHEWEWSTFSTIVCDANIHVVCEQKHPLISSNFNPLMKCIEQFPWTQRIDCTPLCMASL